MAKQVYRARPGARLHDSDAAVIGRTLDAIGFDGKPATFVSAARPKTSPLHRYFEWNNDVAAELHRLEQARLYLRSIEIVITSSEGETRTRAWHQIVIEHEDGGDRRYAASVEIAQDEDLQAQVIAKALRELRGWQRRYSEYRHVFGDIFAAIESARHSRCKVPA
jgi:hypothetical protein